MDKSILFPDEITVSDSRFSTTKYLSFHRLLNGRCLCREFDQDFFDSSDPRIVMFGVLSSSLICDEDFEEVCLQVSIVTVWRIRRIRNLD